tara:strand:+ start:41 stop:886 length:846 start_codon:yes stop_codon:yes gene_type:complete
MTIQAVVFIHGVGAQKKGYSKKIKKLITDKVDDFISGDAGLIFREVLWAPVTETHQKDLWKRVNKKGDLDLIKLRKFFISFGGDFIAYQQSKVGKPVYDDVNEKVQIEIDSIKKEYPGEKIEFTFVSHSLGTVIITNYLHNNSKPKSPKIKKIQATNLFTLGSPLALWTLLWGGAANATKPVQVSRPNGAWINILDDEDIIGYPLKSLNSEYNKAVDKDYVTEIGGLFSMGNPLSHMKYWEDRNVIKPIAYKLKMDYFRIHNGKPYKRAEYLRYINSLWNY